MNEKSITFGEINSQNLKAVPQWLRETIDEKEFAKTLSWCRNVGKFKEERWQRWGMRVTIFGLILMITLAAGLLFSLKYKVEVSTGVVALSFLTSSAIAFIGLGILDRSAYWKEKVKRTQESLYAKIQPYLQILRDLGLSDISVNTPIETIHQLIQKKLVDIAKLILDGESKIGIEMKGSGAVMSKAQNIHLLYMSIRGWRGELTAAQNGLKLFGVVIDLGQIFAEAKKELGGSST
jgi:hypothetical protein